MALFAFTAHQQQLFEAIAAKTTTKCANMYYGAIKVLADGDNPERLHLAAHSLRELMEKIGPFLEIPIPSTQLKQGYGNLTEKFKHLEDLIDKAEAKSGNCTKGIWAGPIHKLTATVLVEVQNVKKWRKANADLRATKIENLINKLDPLHKALPKEIQTLRINEWECIEQFFIRVSHHKDTTSAEFEQWLTALEAMLLRGLTPMARKSLSEVDAIINAGENR
jgi:hypothetical protein